MKAYLYKNGALEILSEDSLLNFFESELKELFEDATPPPIGSATFTWITHDGRFLTLDEMDTKHIFYALRMIYNHTVPPVFRVLGEGETMRRWDDVAGWNAGYKANAVAHLTAELERRDDLDKNLRYQFEDMKANTEVVLALGL
jgi:hypothetical protein